jgi:hypothetical protein
MTKLTRVLALTVLSGVISAGLAQARGGGGAARGGGGGAVRSSGRTNVSSTRNYNTNVNVNRNVNVNANVNRGGGYYGGGGCCYHPVARGVAIGATAAITAAAIGSVVNTLPPSCSSMVVNGLAYQQCGGSYYQPQVYGSTTTYVVVNPPR